MSEMPLCSGETGSGGHAGDHGTSPTVQNCPDALRPGTNFSISKKENP